MEFIIGCDHMQHSGVDIIETTRILENGQKVEIELYDDESGYHANCPICNQTAIFA